MDYKDWIEEEAIRIAAEEFNCDFYNIHDDFQFMIYQTAEENYWERMAPLADVYADMIMERQMEERCETMNS